MYQIAVCDDERVFAHQLAAQLAAIMEEKGVPYQLDLYESCDRLQAALEDGGKSYHIYFLDILMEGLDGMEFARLLRRGDQASTIVFITCTDQYIKQGYDVAARQYLEKPIDLRELRDILLQDYEKKFQKQYVTVRQGTSIRSIPLEQIVCLEAKGRKLLYHLLDETIAVTATEKFDLLGEILPEGFVRCHRSYYLYIESVQRLHRTEAVAKNNQIVPVSRSCYREVQQAFLKHARRISITATAAGGD